MPKSRAGEAEQESHSNEFDGVGLSLILKGRLKDSPANVQETLNIFCEQLESYAQMRIAPYEIDFVARLTIASILSASQIVDPIRREKELDTLWASLKSKFSKTN